MITTIVFDFDGTIADTLPAIMEIARTIAPQYGVKHAESLQLADLKDKSPFQLLNLLQIPIYKIPFILNHGRELLEKKLHKIPPHKDVLSTIKILKEKGYKLGILSSNSVQVIEKFLKNHSVEGFDFVHSEKNIFGKDKALNNLLNRYALEKDQVLYIGDEIRDIDACHKANIKVVSVTWGFNSRKALENSKPDYLIDRPQELINILDN